MTPITITTSGKGTHKIVYAICTIRSSYFWYNVAIAICVRGPITAGLNRIHYSSNTHILQVNLWPTVQPPQDHGKM